VEVCKTGKFDVDVTAAFNIIEPGKPVRSDIIFFNEESYRQIQSILDLNSI
jgi:hypothetical protein